MKRYLRVVALALGAVLMLGIAAAPAMACDCTCESECRSPGYWKTHPCEWPVDSIMIGGVEYTKAEAIEWMGMRGGDKSVTLFRALVAAKLNVMAGCPACCVSCVISRADTWMAAHPVGSGVAASSCAWDYAECLYWKLDAYNNGYLVCSH